MIEIQDLAGQTVHVMPDALLQFYPHDFAFPNGGVTVLIAGGLLLTREPGAHLAERIKNDVKLVALHLRGGDMIPVWISVKHISMIKPGGTGTVIAYGGRTPEWIAENYDTVLAKIRAAS